MVETLYQQYLSEGNEEGAANLLTDYQKDFFGATINRWDEAWQSPMEAALGRILTNIKYN